MGLLFSLSGSVRVEYTSADIGSVLGELEKKQITVFDVSAVSELALQFTVGNKQFGMLSSMAERRGEKLRVVERMGLFWPLRAGFGRPLLIGGILILITVGIILPGRILFVSVEGNERIPTNRILEAAAESGLGFGVERRSIRSEQIKNRLLDVIPEIKWAGVNTYGSRAVITVRERDDTKEQQAVWPIRHIVAGRDGVITSCTVTAGCGVCSVGQAVKEGDVLISGYTDCGITFCASAAEGQIMAATNRKLTVLTPAKCRMRGQLRETKPRYSVTIGKKRINFYKGSGISDGSCVKMYSEYVLRLPGGFPLPIVLCKESIMNHDLLSADANDPETVMKSFAADYLRSQMTSGEVIGKQETLTESEALWILEGEYACTEDIGIIQDEKIGDFHGKADGADRERGSGG